MLIASIASKFLSYVNENIIPGVNVNIIGGQY